MRYLMINSIFLRAHRLYMDEVRIVVEVKYIERHSILIISSEFSSQSLSNIKKSH